VNMNMVFLAHDLGSVFDPTEHAERN
jgi:hypothetical protein